MWKPAIFLTQFLTIRLVGLFSWLFTVLASAFVVQNYENWAADRGISDVLDTGAPSGWWQSAMMHLSTAAEYAMFAAGYIAGPFGIGLAIGAAIFSIPDILSAYRRVAELRASAMNAAERSALRRKNQRAVDDLREWALARLADATLGSSALMGSYANHLMRNGSVSDKINALCISSTTRLYLILASENLRAFAKSAEDQDLNELIIRICRFSKDQYRSMGTMAAKIKSLAPEDKEVKKWQLHWERSDPECWMRLLEISERHNLDELRELSRDMRTNFQLYEEHYVLLDG